MKYVSVPSDGDVCRDPLAQAVSGGDDKMALAIEAESSALDFLMALRGQMRDTGLTQKELADRLQLPDSQLNRWLTGSTAMKLQTAIMIARASGGNLTFSWPRAGVALPKDAKLRLVSGGWSTGANQRRHLSSDDRFSSATEQDMPVAA